MHCCFPADSTNRCRFCASKNYCYWTSSLGVGSIVLSNGDLLSLRILNRFRKWPVSSCAFRFVCQREIFSSMRIQVVISGRLLSHYSQTSDRITNIKNQEISVLMLIATATCRPKHENRDNIFGAYSIKLWYLFCINFKRRWDVREGGDAAANETCSTREIQLIKLDDVVRYFQNRARKTNEQKQTSSLLVTGCWSPPAAIISIISFLFRRLHRCRSAVPAGIFDCDKIVKLNTLTPFFNRFSIVYIRLTPMLAKLQLQSKAKHTKQKKRN